MDEPREWRLGLGFPRDADVRGDLPVHVDRVGYEFQKRNKTTHGHPTAVQAVPSNTAPQQLGDI